MLVAVVVEENFSDIADGWAARAVHEMDMVALHHGTARNFVAVVAERMGLGKIGNVCSAEVETEVVVVVHNLVCQELHEWKGEIDGGFDCLLDRQNFCANLARAILVGRSCLRENVEQMLDRYDLRTEVEGDLDTCW